MNIPLLTIGVPVFNEERFLEETLESILSQSFSNSRILISDNGSSDNSFEIAKRFAARDKRVELVRQDPPLDASGNFRFLLAQANTKYFMWAGAHDIIINNFIEDGINALESAPDMSMVYPDTIWIDAGSNLVSIPWKNDDLDTTGEKKLEKKLVKVATNTFCCNAFYGIMRTDCARDIPFVKMIGADHLTLFHLAVKGNIRYLREPGFKARIIREETMEERTERYIRNGIIAKDDKYPYEFHTANYFNYIRSIKTINILGKIKLILLVRKVMHRKFNVNRRSLVRYYIYNLFGV